MTPIDKTEQPIPLVHEFRVTRQIARRRLYEILMMKINSQYPAMPRAERKERARAQAAIAWKTRDGNTINLE
jgi:hypothetical protein